MARKALIGIVALLAMIFFTSVICPPVHERDGLPDETVGVADTLPNAGEVQIERSPVENEAPTRDSIPPAPSMAAVHFWVDLVDDQGTPLSGVTVALSHLDFDTKPFEEQFSIGLGLAISSDGEALLRAAKPGEYWIMARMDSMLTAKIHLELPLPEGAERPQLVLTRAAIFAGTVQDLSGNSVVYGELVVTNIDTGVEQIAQARGSHAEFKTAPLPTGNWSIAWREHRHAEIDPRLVFHTPLAAGETRRLQFTLARGRPTSGAVPGVLPSPR